MATDKKTGMTLPAGILASTTRREEPLPIDEGQGGEPVVPAEASAAKAAAPTGPAKGRRMRTGPKAEKVEGRRLYLSEGVHFRLRLLAYQRGQKLSEVAEDVLDKALPKYDVSRTG